jgi:hypothetical protein
VHCRVCGKDVPDQAVICVGCGSAPRNGKKFCWHCGEATRPTAVACLKCGVGLVQKSDLGSQWVATSGQRRGLIVCGLVGMVSIFLPWASVLGMSVAGSSIVWGWIVFALFATSAILAFSFGTRTEPLRDAARFQVPLPAAAAGGVSIWIMVGLSDQARGTQTGFGLYLGLFAAIASVVVGLGSGGGSPTPRALRRASRGTSKEPDLKQRRRGRGTRSRGSADAKGVSAVDATRPPADAAAGTSESPTTPDTDSVSS